jgi:hypothetical protein
VDLIRGSHFPVGSSRHRRAGKYLGAQTLVAAAGLAWASFFNELDRQTAFRGSFGPQRLSGAVSNHHSTLLVEKCPIKVIERKPNGQRVTFGWRLDGPLGWPMKARHGPPLRGDHDLDEPSRARRRWA